MRLIDADELDDVVIDLNQKGWAITRNEYKRIDGILFEFPTVDTVKHGRWETEIKTNRDGTKSCLYACSLCGILSLDEFWYCPHCGAKMDGDENG